MYICLYAHIYIHLKYICMYIYNKKVFLSADNQEAEGERGGVPEQGGQVLRHHGPHP